jgi:hypothetical protein
MNKLTVLAVILNLSARIRSVSDIGFDSTNSLFEITKFVLDSLYEPGAISNSAAITTGL